MPAFPKVVSPQPERLIADPMVLDCRGHILDCRDGRPAHVMGILNLTPDSFSDGGQFSSVDQALHRAEEMLSEGATILDVGGESTRPRGTAYGTGAETISAQEEMDRTIPVIEALARDVPHAVLSIDTYKGEVARAALKAGAHMVNDVTGVRHGVGTARAAADFGAALVLMHAPGMPGEMPHEYAYADLMGTVATSLATSVDIARKTGTKHIVIDPGFGFGKSVEGNLELIARLDLLTKIGRPILVGISRKSTVGAVLGSPRTPRAVGDRLFGTLGLTALAVIRGASIVRTHDVQPTADLINVLAAAEAVALPEATA